MVSQYENEPGGASKQCVVVIPVYKSRMSDMERTSYCRTLEVLGPNWDIVIVTHKGVDMSEYNDWANRRGFHVTVSLFDPLYFDGIHGYNKLMLSRGLYLTFSEYKYMLVCQLDVYIFRDELADWCDKGYDYIGAPLFASYTNTTTDRGAMTGNGGLSLRLISKMLYVMGYPERWHLGEIMRAERPRHEYIKPQRRVFYALMQLAFGRAEWLKNYLMRFVDEDRYLSFATLGTTRQLRIPPCEVSRHFAYDMNPEFWHRLNDGKLPFGAHAWIKYYDRFYKNYIAEI